MDGRSRVGPGDRPAGPSSTIGLRLARRGAFPVESCKNDGRALAKSAGGDL